MGREAAAPPPEPPAYLRAQSSLVIFEGARRNTAPLGALQTGGRRDYDFEGSVRADPPSVCRATGLARTGISRLPVVRWYHGELSGELALREVLDAVESCVGAESRERRELIDAVRLYGHACDVLGGPVGAAIGGVPLSPLTVSEAAPPIAAGLWALVFSQPPADAMRAALGWVTAAETDANGRVGATLAQLRKALAGMSSEEANLEFKRACLATHPKRPGGRLVEHVCVHIHYELVRHCWETSHPALFGGRGGSGADEAEEGELHEPQAHDALAECAVRTALEYDLISASGGSAPAPKLGGRALVPPLPGGLGVREYNARVERYLSHLCAVRDELAEEVERLQHNGAFATLGASPDDSTAELTRVYRAQAKRLHPDRNGGDKSAFQELQQAYETIMKERRAAQEAESESESSDDEDDSVEAATTPRGGRTPRGPKPKPKPKAGAEGGDGAEGAEAEGAAKKKTKKEQQGGGAPASEDADAAPGADEPADAAPPAADGAPAAAPGSADGADGAEAEAEAEAEADPAVAELLESLRKGKEAAEQAARGASRQGARPAPDGAEDAGSARADGSAGAKPGGGGGADGGGGGGGAEPDGADDVTGVHIGGVRPPPPLPTEVASEHAELAAEHASMCTRSSKIAASVAAASKAGGRGGSSVLLSAAGLILDCAEKAAGHARRAGSAAAAAPSAVMPTLHGLCAEQLGVKEEKAVRKLMSVVLAAASAGEASLEAVNELELSTGKNVRESLALMRAHAGSPVAAVAGPLAAQMLAQVGKAAVRCAEAAMAAAMALADLQQRIDRVFQDNGKEGPPRRGPHGKRRGSKHAHSRRGSKAGQKGGKGSDEEEEGEGGAEGGDKENDRGGSSKPGGPKPGAPASEDAADPASAVPTPQSPDERRLLENRQLLLKLNAQVVTSQAKIKQLLGASPGLIAAVTEPQKESLFALLAEAIGDAESRLARRWYEAGCGQRLSMADWIEAVREATTFVTHGAATERIAVPYSLTARLLREAALVDNHLLCSILRKELFDKILLLSPDARSKADESALADVRALFDGTIRAVAALSAAP